MTDRFARVTVRAAAMNSLSGCDLRVYIAIAAHANSDGLAWPGMSMLAAMTSILRGDIPRSIRRLEQASLIRREGLHGDTRANVYRVILDGEPTPTSTTSDVSNPADSKAADVSNPADSEIAAGVSARLLQSVSKVADQTDKNRPKNKYTPRKRAAPYFVSTVADVQFEEFWRKYPSRGGHNNPKKPAREKFLATVGRGVDPKLIIGAVGITPVSLPAAAPRRST
jgi:hypothetical protein